MANNTNTKRIEALEGEMTNLNAKLDKLIEMMSGKPAVKNSRGSATATKSVDRKAEQKAFMENHEVVYTAQQNRQRVYDAMKSDGIEGFDRRAYEKYAKKLGVLGKSGKVVGTYKTK